MNDISKEQVWALRGVASRMGQVGHLAVIELCDNLLAAQKERDEAQRNLENIKAAREEDAIKALADVREAALAHKLGNLVNFVGKMRSMLDGSMTAHAQIREAAGVLAGDDIVNHVAVMRNSAERTAEERQSVRLILDAKEDETLVDAANRVAEEAEGLYKFKCRIREALGVEKGVDMAAEVKKLKMNSEYKGAVCRQLADRFTRVTNTVSEIGDIVGSKSLTAEGVLAHVKSLPTAVNELRHIALKGLGYMPDFLAVGRCEGLADSLLRDKLAVEIRNAIARGTGSPFMRDTLYQLCEEAGIAWPGENVDGVDNIRKAISSFVKARMAEILFLQTQCEAASKRAKEAEGKVAMAKNEASQEVARDVVRDWLRALCTALKIEWTWDGRPLCEVFSEIVDAIVSMVGDVNGYDNAMMRQNLAEKTAALELAGKRIQELESTIREHEKDLKVLDELQDEQTKLVALLMRKAEGKSGPQIVVEWPIIRDHRTGVNRMGIPVVTSPNVPRNTWGFLL